MIVSGSVHETLRPALQQGHARVALVVGGALGAAAEFYQVVRSDLILRIDVANELPGIVSPRHLELTLADGVTLAHMARLHGCPPKVLEFLESRAAVDTAHGLAQFPPAGALAVRHLLDSPGMETFLVEEVYNKLLKIHNGTPQTVETIGLAGAGGGTGSPALVPLLEALTSVILAHTGGTVTTHIVRVGGASFIDLGARAQLNAAVCAEQDLDFVNAADRHENESRRATITELPMVGADREARNRDGAQFLQAYLSRDTRTLIDRVEPNAAYASEFGAVAQVRASFFETLPEHPVAQQIAEHMRAGIVACQTDTSRSGRVDEIVVTLPEGAVRPVHDEREVLALIRRSGPVRPENIEQICSAVTTPERGAKVSFRLASGVRLDPEAVRHTLPMEYSQVESTHRRYTTLKELVHRLRDQVEFEKSKMRAAKATHHLDQERLREAMEQVFPKGWSWKRVKALILSREHLGAELRGAAEATSQAAVHVEEARLKLQAVEEALKVVATELAAESAILNRALGVLGQFASRGSAGDPWVVPSDLDRVFEPLMTMITTTEPDTLAVQRLLLRAVSKVTLAGLAQVVGAKIARPEVIAGRIHHGEARRSPSWGFAEPKQRPTRIVVLPPLEKQLEEQMRTQIRRVDADVLVTCSETAEAGVNVVVLDVYKPSRREDIITPYVQKNLEQADREPELYRTAPRRNGRAVVPVDES